MALLTLLGLVTDFRSHTFECLFFSEGARTVNSIQLTVCGATVAQALLARVRQARTAAQADEQPAA